MKRKKKLIGVGLLVGLPALALGILWVLGSQLDPHHLVTREVTLDRPVAAVWGQVSNLQGSATWRPDVEEVRREVAADGSEVFCERNAHGELRYVIEESHPERRLVTRISSKS